MEIDKPAADAAANAASFSGSSPASDGEQHRRGIPVAQFVADVEAFLAGREAPARPLSAALSSAPLRSPPLSSALLRSPLLSFALLPSPPLSSPLLPSPPLSFALLSPPLSAALLRRSMVLESHHRFAVFLMQQYKLLEIKLLTQKRDLQSKLPDIKKSQEIVQTLVKKREEKQQVRLDYVLADGVFARADVKDADSVCLWLGANVMVEYPFDEALALLARNEENATSSLANIDGDLLFVRDQINITEVTVARVHNWDVQRRRAAGAGSSTSALREEIAA
ncbi:unnamed protein product [Closterium sp. NIES-65]|nr:unnamed protein product [Closterium sp. NIES-65]